MTLASNPRTQTISSVASTSKLSPPLSVSLLLCSRNTPALRRANGQVPAAAGNSLRQLARFVSGSCAPSTNAISTAPSRQRPSSVIISPGRKTFQPLSCRFHQLGQDTKRTKRPPAHIRNTIRHLAKPIRPKRWHLRRRIRMSAASATVSMPAPCRAPVQRSATQLLLNCANPKHRSPCPRATIVIEP